METVISKLVLVQNQKIRSMLFFRQNIYFMSFIPAQKAMEIVNILERPFQASHGLLLQEILHPRVTEISDGEYSCALSSQNYGGCILGHTHEQKVIR